MIPEAFLIEAAKPVISLLVKNVITPKIQKFAEKCHIAYNDLLIPKGEHFEEYLHRTYKKYSIINTLVFKNEQRLLIDLYVPLTLAKESHHGNDDEQVKVDKYPVDIVKKYNKILIMDTAGMGKSTLTKRLFLDIIENGHGIPIYLEMRRLTKERPILVEIQEQISSLSKKFDTALLLEFIQIGGFIFFLDGYDEIALDERSAVTTNIQDFISKAGKNTFILTSRPEQALTSFGDFQVFRINPLAKKEAYELLRKYDKQGIVSKRLIDELKSGQYEAINEFLKNPLLVSLLFAAFEYKQTIPLKKHVFYRQVYDAYFDSHDLSKGDSYIHDKCSNLDIDDFERVLRYVGYLCLKCQKIEFEKDVLLQIIDKAKDFCPDLSFCSSDYLTDLLRAVPLFCKDGQYYKWVHKSLQEYFAAQFIYKDSKRNQDDILSALYNSDNIDKYINLLDLYYDIDIWGFRKNILLPLCNSYIKFYEEKIYSSNIIDKKYIEKRIGLLFMRKIGIEKNNTITRFEEADKQAKNILGQKATIISYYPNGIIVYEYYSPLLKLLSLLVKRQKHLFAPCCNKKFNDLKQMLLNDKIIYVDIHSGDNNVDEFEELNFYLSGGLEKDKYLNYEACKNEAEIIKTNIEKKEKISILVDGL